MKKYLDVLEGYHLVLQISGVMLCSIFGSLFGGIYLDKSLNSTPWFMFIFMFLGIILAVYTIATIVEQHKE